MYSVTRSFGLNGLSGFAVAVEADISGGLPAFSIVGLPDSAVRESADRVRAAIKGIIVAFQMLIFRKFSDIDDIDFYLSRTLRPTENTLFQSRKHIGK